MAQKLMSLSKWRTLEEGELARFDNKKPRTVRIDVNASEFTRLYIGRPNGEAKFLACVSGRDVIEFSVDGAFDITADQVCDFYTVDGTDWSVAAVDDRSFTRIVERRRRNPELEYMMRAMQMNVERRLEQTKWELQEQYDRRDREREQRQRAVDPGAGVKKPAKSGAEPGKPDAGGKGGDAANTNAAKQPEDAGSKKA